jgi:methylmalonyl-CoA mutase
MDPIGQLARDGNWFTTKDKNNFDSLNLLSTAVPDSSIISIDATCIKM